MSPIINKFHANQYVLHIQTKKVYVILMAPHPLRRLEETNETFYSYESANARNKKVKQEDKVIWYRSKSNMEEPGRFQAYTNTDMKNQLTEKE